ncbi:Molybdopterin or thiamine biosynthesis adenylyltransferase [Geoalkalibacter ferrihydriticus]|uniref:Thiamine biosynthesis protein ThiF n=2 Tax=Geoalkalibacter ferrihydriticus TaxID=392333 RepID=A0A0C2HFY3_9BACT|nr:ThiF family adenylyltransferase [Geoalkalibacter ferrihydriticus]KIH75851.1 thiamine biosynthesis protein ThiF [Geoalkalibacter ferrihydriticus DSM 17813]SDM68093.1 Molybdopterin or thiamine biosynthesis adenylyltransferase [Geoalkalibacter ferrihydriticus]
MSISKLISQEFSRNIGLVSETDQEKLLKARVAVAGAGGVGGIHLLTLARMGVGNFNIADLDDFERANISRQFGAFQSTVGRHKAQVMAEIVREINPEADLRIFPQGVTNENVEEFLADCQVYVDGIDFFEFEIRRLLFNTARAMGIYAVTAAPLGFGATLQVFSPTGMSFDDYFGISTGMTYEEKIASFAAGLAPQAFHAGYLDSTRIDIEKRKGPAVAPACTLCASLVTTEVVKIITGKGKLRPVPRYLQFDMRLQKWKKGYTLFGGKNPLHRLRSKAALKFFTKGTGG